MSLAGIRSNRGDSYQTLVAFHWTLSVLSDPEYQCIEVDSVAWSVDDVVIEKSDGTKICCQCKKNQKDFNPWTITDLADELKKAANLLASDPKAEVRFYSRSPFGALAKLREHCTTQPDDFSYRSSLTVEQKKTDAELAKHLAGTLTLSSYEFLQRTMFETSPELDRMEALLRERLRYMACNAMVAFDAIWRRLDHLGARMGGNGRASTQHRLTKEDLKALLHRAGALLVPVMALGEVRSSFTNISAIGRAWRRDISGLRVSNSVVHDLLAAIDARQRAILLTGSPGSGKTCLILEAQEALEQLAKTRTDLVPLFIQSREFADLVTAQDRQAHGLPQEWVEKVARMAEEAHVVIMIDSLDVLSIAREHSVLTYFLAQIDRLLLIPHVTVVAACREFDRHYDRRIAERKWDVELKCSALRWDADIVPLLRSLSIKTTNIDALTRELIRNPRELALFVELAEREGSFNVVTSQALAQRYLDSIVRADERLGDGAMQAIEAVADHMLKTRSLSIPRQRFNASPVMQRTLLSQNVLHETQEGKLTFGHQTLLDVLVISSAFRKGMTLGEFIQRLSPVPFVRPSIRSFVAQLATGERREFRKQLRAVMMGSTAFHIRRLVAESFAEQKPQDDDWPLLHDLRDKHRDVFQVIYTQAKGIDWHHFWFKHLVPLLKDSRDSEGLSAHVHRISQWINEDVTAVLAFWEEAVALDWIDGGQIARQIGHYLIDANSENAVATAPLINKLLDIPEQEHSFLGRAIARCISGGGGDDVMLWRFVAGRITDDDALAFQFGEKLRCAVHEFGGSNNDFFTQRMKQSTALLDLAIQSVEKWSHTRISGKGPWMAGQMGFLGDTSYQDSHSDTEIRHKDSESVLLNALEAAILVQAQTNSQWWATNRERLCFSHEGAFRYFGIIACTKFPDTNIDLIRQVLCNREFLELELSYELGTLLNAAFIYLDPDTQDAVQTTVLTLHDDESMEEHGFWIRRKRAELIVAIPCHLRISEAQAVLSILESEEGTLTRQPQILSRGGMVRPPFSFDIFLEIEDDCVLQLLRHYAGYSDRHGMDFLVGGEREVGGQLREAASLQPARFLHLLRTHWPDISKSFRDDIMGGIANYVAHRFGDLQPNSGWKPLEEPDPLRLSHDMLNELERHAAHWRYNRAASDALQACAHVIQNTQDANRLVFLAIGFSNFEEERPVIYGRVELVTTGINMITGRIVEALMILANQLHKKNIAFPELLPVMLRRFAGHEHPAIRALALRHLPFLQSQNPELGWGLFNIAIQGDATGLWETAEPCLYYAYRSHFDKVEPFISRLRLEGQGKDLETWGRISALAALAKRIDFANWLGELKDLDATDAWRGASTVWTHWENIKQHREQCLAGIEAGLNAKSPNPATLTQEMSRLFHRTKPPISVPIGIIRRCFLVLESEVGNKNTKLFGFVEWLNSMSQRDPELAMAATDIYLDYVSRTKRYIYDNQNNLTQLLTRLFAEAEEREESDGGEMLQRVVALQDSMLALGVNGVNEWLGAAERP